MLVPTRVVVCLIAAVLVACQPSSSESTPSAPSTPATRVTPAASDSDGSMVAPASASSPASPVAAASSEAGGLFDLTGPELFLATGIATEIRRSCGRAPDLPAEAIAGLQCHPGSTGIEAK